MHAVGVFGGTFDPIHFGHLRLAEEMAEALGLARVLFIPAGQPPHRGTPRTPATHRLEMARRAVQGNPRFTVDGREVAAPGPSYTVDTLTALRAELGTEVPVWLLLGGDAFLGLPTWHQWRRLFELAHLAVATRPNGGARIGEPSSELQQEIAQRRNHDTGGAPAGFVRMQAMTPLGISATAIRAALARHESARYLLPDAVLDYIHEHRLYIQP